MLAYNYPFWRVLVLLLGVGLTANGVLLFVRTNLNLGNILTLGLGVMFLLYAIYFEWVNNNFPVWLKTIIAVLLSLVVLFASFLYVYGIKDNVNYKEDAIVVLGAAVRGEQPSLALADRLDKAAEYYSKNPKVYIIVSGGQGAQENVTEAYAMEKYLIGKGVPKEKILKEEKSTSTFENFVFSKEILDKTFEQDYNVAFVSNEYHIYRAQNIARKAGIENAAHIHSTTRWYSVSTGTLRECLAVLKFWILG